MDLTNQRTNQNGKQTAGESMNNQQSLNKSDENNVLGYGDMDPNAKILSNMTNKTNQ